MLGRRRRRVRRGGWKPSPLPFLTLLPLQLPLPLEEKKALETGEGEEEGGALPLTLEGAEKGNFFLLHNMFAQ